MHNITLKSTKHNHYKVQKTVRSKNKQGFQSDSLDTHRRIQLFSQNMDFRIFQNVKQGREVNYFLKITVGA